MTTTHSVQPGYEKAAFAQLLQDIRQFLATEVMPAEPQLLHGAWAEIRPLLDAQRERVKALGWWTPQVPEAWGGMGLSLTEFGQVSELLGMTPYGHYIFNCQAPDAGNMEILMEFGTPLQQDRYLRPLLAGDIRSCFSMTEPEFAGSNPVMMGTTGVLEGDTYRISGHKWFTSAADGAAFAIVMCVTQPDAAPHQRASQIIVPLDTPGFELVRNIPVMGEAGGGWLSHAEVRYHDCQVGADHLLGEDGAGFAIAQTRLGPGRIHHCMRWIGICERAFDLMCRRAATREIAPGRVLAQQQVVQHRIAECRAEINAARHLVMEAAQKIDSAGTYAARTEISIIKFYCAGVLQKVVDQAIQVHGALGVTEDTLLSFWYRHERGARIYDGADEVHKTTVAKQVMKGYGVKI